MTHTLTPKHVLRSNTEAKEHTTEQSDEAVSYSAQAFETARDVFLHVLKSVSKSRFPTSFYYSDLSEDWGTHIVESLLLHQDIKPS